MSVIAPEWLRWPETQILLDAFARANKECRFVGGCVRDALLNRAVFDLDLATSALPDETMDLLNAADIRVIPTGIAHGTVTAVIGKHHFEITTLRRDVACDGRHAQVEYTDDWQQDAARRDFTMNALYADASGRITDYFDGEADARVGHVRFIGDAAARIEEDALRILRFFRFHAHYGSDGLDTRGFTACAEHKALLDGLSGERIQTEMFKLLRAQSPVAVLEAMHSAGILAYLQIPGAVRPLSRLILAEAELQMPPDAVRRLGMLMHNRSEEEVRALCTRWRLSNADQKRLRMLALPGIAIRAEMSEAEQKQAIRKLGKNDFIDSVLLAGAWVNQFCMPMIALAQSWEIPEFPLRGEDLIQAGVAPGKGLGETLAKLEAEWEAGDYRLDKAALLALLK